MRPLLEFLATEYESLAALKALHWSVCLLRARITNVCRILDETMSYNLLCFISFVFKAFGGIHDKRNDITDPALRVTDADLPFQVETDAFDHSIAGTFALSGFFFRSTSLLYSLHHIFERKLMPSWNQFLNASIFLR